MSKSKVFVLALSSTTIVVLVMQYIMSCFTVRGFPNILDIEVIDIVMILFTTVALCLVLKYSDLKDWKVLVAYVVVYYPFKEVVSTNAIFTSSLFSLHIGILIPVVLSLLLVFTYISYQYLSPRRIQGN